MKTWRMLPILILVAACVDPIVFTTPPAENTLVVEGSITNKEGPHQVFLSRSFNNQNPTRFRDPVVDAQIELYEDGVKIDSFTEKEDGVYETKPTVIGKVGKTYHIIIRTKDNNEYVSDPELLREPGVIENVVHEFEQGSPDFFSVYIDARAKNPDGYLRWRVTGTYRVISFPERAIRQDEIDGPIFLDPVPCSGYIAVSPTAILKVGPCTCCECWITNKTPVLYISDKFLGSGSFYPRSKVGEVKVTRRTFYDKYHVDIEQLSISPGAHEFFRQVKAQTEGAGSLFQPSFGAIEGNLHSTNDEDVVGLFWAGGVSNYSFVLDRRNVPYTIPPIDTLADDCHVVGPSSYTKPPFW